MSTVGGSRERNQDEDSSRWRHIYITLMGHAGPSVSIVWQIQMSHRSLLGKNNQSNHSTRAAIPFDCFLQGTSHKVNAFLLSHLLFPVCIRISIDVRRARSSNCKRLLVQRSSQGYRVYLTAVSRIISCNDDSGTVATGQQIETSTKAGG